jgi:hypothetical protein
MRSRAAVPTPPTPTTAPLTERIGILLRRAQPFAYCDACLADYFLVPLSAAQRAARWVGATDGFSRKPRRCRTCHELTDVTWRVRPVSSFLFLGR